MHVVFPRASQENDDDKDSCAYVDEDEANGESSEVLGRYAIQNPMLNKFHQERVEDKQVELNDQPWLSDARKRKRDAR